MAGARWRLGAILLVWRRCNAAGEASSELGMEAEEEEEEEEAEEEADSEDEDEVCLFLLAEVAVALVAAAEGAVVAGGMDRGRRAGDMAANNVRRRLCSLSDCKLAASRRCNWAGETGGAESVLRRAEPSRTAPPTLAAAAAAAPKLASQGSPMVAWIDGSKRLAAQLFIRAWSLV